MKILIIEACIICSANQLTGFFMKRSLFLKGLAKQFRKQDFQKIFLIINVFLFPFLLIYGSCLSHKMQNFLIL